MRIHTGEKPFKCATCDYTARTKGNLDNHMRKHTGERPFICKLCQKSYTQKSSLNTHIKTVHSDNGQVLGPIKKDNKERPYQVRFWFKNFRSKNWSRNFSARFAISVTLKRARSIPTWKALTMLTRASTRATKFYLKSANQWSSSSGTCKAWTTMWLVNSKRLDCWISSTVRWLTSSPMLWKLSDWNPKLRAALQPDHRQLPRNSLSRTTSSWSREMSSM